MNKQEFLKKLRKNLSGLPKKEQEERLTFYAEMIEDHMEEGLSEEEAVSAVGSVDEIMAQAAADTPKTSRKLSAGALLLLILGSPIWLSLGIAAFAVIFSLYASLWSVVLSLWAVFASLAAVAVASVPACIIFTAGGNGASGIAVLAAGLVCAGLSIFLFYGCRAATKGAFTLTKKPAIWIRNHINKKEVAS